MFEVLSSELVFIIWKYSGGEIRYLCMDVMMRR